jgi:hypothetical protein
MVETVRLAGLPLMVVIGGFWFALGQVLRGLVKLLLAALVLVTMLPVAAILVVAAIRRLLRGGSVHDLYADLDATTREWDEEDELKEAIRRIQRFIDARAREGRLHAGEEEEEKSAADDLPPRAAPPWGRGGAQDASPIDRTTRGRRRAARRSQRP